MPREVTVAALGSGGDGVVEDAGRKQFVPFALPGERLTFDFPPRRDGPIAVRLLEASSARIEPPCFLHGDLDRPGCGGCRMQHFAMPDYAAWKQGLVTSALARVGVECAVQPLLLSPPHSRRRASLTLERRGGRTRLGFNERGTHKVVDMTMCLILRPELFALVEPLRRTSLLREGERADLALAISQGAIDLLLERKRPLDLAEREGLAAFAETHNLARVSWRAGPREEVEPVSHRRSFTACFGKTTVLLPPGGFLQATEQGEAALQGVLSSVLPQGCATLDLFAGSGTFTFVAAGTGRVHAVEGNDAALGAVRGARHDKVTVEKRDLFRNPVDDFERYDAAIFDPPYTGGESQAKALGRSGPPLVVAMACNPVSFAHDARLLADGGYRLDSVTPIDQFLWSADVEVAAVFRK